jgi:hypothetical protein
MLVFTVFSTIGWNSVFNYQGGRAQMANDWNLMTGRWKTEKVIMADDPDSHNDSNPIIDCPGDEECDADCDKPNAPANQASRKLDNMGSLGKPKSFKRRFHDDQEFRRTFCLFADRCCLVATFVVYLVSFTVICTSSSESDYGALDTVDPLQDAERDFAVVDELRQDWLGSLRR